jgi:hypothetical protein
MRNFYEMRREWIEVGRRSANYRALHIVDLRQHSPGELLERVPNGALADDMRQRAEDDIYRLSIEQDF